MGTGEGPDNGNVWGLSKGPLGSIFGENSFNREIWGTRRGGLHVAKHSSE